MKTRIRTDAGIFKWCLLIVLLWRLALEVINQTIVPLMTPGPDDVNVAPLHAGVQGLWRWAQNWDGSWYLAITQHGYVITDNFKTYESIAFFPLFPFMIHYLSDVTFINYKILGLILNLLITSFILFFTYKLTTLLASNNKIRDPDLLGKLAATFVIINPASFFFAAYYADALLVLLATSSIYFAHKNQFLVATILAGLATATKSIGVALFPTILIIMINKHYQNRTLNKMKTWIKLGALSLISVSGILSYMLYQQIKYKDAFKFIEVEKFWNRNVSGFFLTNLWNGWYSKLFNYSYYHPLGNYLYSLYLMFIPVAILSFCIYLYIRYKFRYLWLIVFSLICILLPLSTGTLLSLNRYVLILCPIICYIFVNVYEPGGEKRRQVILILGFLSFISLIVFTAIFLSFRFAG